MGIYMYMGRIFYGYLYIDQWFHYWSNVLWVSIILEVVVRVAGGGCGDSWVLVLWIRKKDQNRALLQLHRNY